MCSSRMSLSLSRSILLDRVQCCCVLYINEMEQSRSIAFAIEFHRERERIPRASVWQFENRNEKKNNSQLFVNACSISSLHLAFVFGFFCFQTSLIQVSHFFSTICHRRRRRLRQQQKCFHYTIILNYRDRVRCWVVLNCVLLTSDWWYKNVRKSDAESNVERKLIGKWKEIRILVIMSATAACTSTEDPNQQQVCNRLFSIFLILWRSSSIASHYVMRVFSFTSSRLSFAHPFDISCTRQVCYCCFFVFYVVVIVYGCDE